MGNFLTKIQRSTLVDVLDRIIPRTGETPGAGKIAIEYLETTAAASSSTGRVVLDTLMAIDVAAGSGHGKPFADVADSAKVSLLRVVEDQYPAVFSEFVDLVYDGYYTDPSVIERLGPDAETPQPRGFPIAPFDPRIVEKVRHIGPRYRST